MSDSNGVQCPSCGGANVEVSAEGIGRCNQCGGEFLLQAGNAEGGDTPEVLDYRGPPLAEEDELSELRIRDVSNLRRGAYRERAYWVIGAALCLMGTVKLALIAWAAWKQNLLLAVAGDVSGAVAAAMMFAVALRRIAALTRDLRHRQREEPPEPPDFSNLGDGSQRLKDLEAMTAPPEAQVGRIDRLE